MPETTLKMEGGGGGFGGQSRKHEIYAMLCAWLSPTQRKATKHSVSRVVPSLLQRTKLFFRSHQRPSFHATGIKGPPSLTITPARKQGAASCVADGGRKLSGIPARPRYFMYRVSKNTNTATPTHEQKYSRSAYRLLLFPSLPFPCVFVCPYNA